MKLKNLILILISSILITGCSLKINSNNETKSIDQSVKLIDKKCLSMFGKNNLDRRKCFNELYTTYLDLYLDEETTDSRKLTICEKDYNKIKYDINTNEVSLLLTLIEYCDKNIEHDH